MSYGGNENEWPTSQPRLLSQKLLLIGIIWLLLFNCVLFFFKLPSIILKVSGTLRLVDMSEWCPLLPERWGTLILLPLSLGPELWLEETVGALMRLCRGQK